jgi:SHS family lactate transporter-like MFS transporter
VYAYVLLLTFVGPEYRGRNFDVAADEDMAAVTGDEGHMGKRHSVESDQRREVV